MTPPPVGYRAAPRGGRRAPRPVAPRDDSEEEYEVDMMSSEDPDDHRDERDDMEEDEDGVDDDDNDDDASLFGVPPVDVSGSGSTSLVATDAAFYTAARQEIARRREHRLREHQWPETIDAVLGTSRAGQTDLRSFLYQHNSHSSNSNNPPPTTTGAPPPRTTPTHTRIGIKGKGGGGAYNIPRSELLLFYRLYYQHVLIFRRAEFLTERQFIEEAPERNLEGYGPLAIDLDFQFSMTDGLQRHLTPDDTVNIRRAYVYRLKELFYFQHGDEVEIFVMQREAPYIDPKNATVVKDGLHMVICMQVDHRLQTILRARIMRDLRDLLQHLPLMNGVSLNTMDKVVDLSIASGKTNWMVFGSRKPGCEPYKLVEHMSVRYRESSGSIEASFAETIHPHQTIDFAMFCRMSVQYPDTPAFPIRRSVVENMDALLADALPAPATRPAVAPGHGVRMPFRVNAPRRTTSSGALALDSGGETDRESVAGNDMQLALHGNEWLDEEINPTFLAEEMGELIDAYGNVRYELMTDPDSAQLVVQYVRAKFLRKKPTAIDAFMLSTILPPRYYEPGSHDLNRKAMFALKNTDDHLFIAWVMLRARASDFNWTTVPALWAEWNSNHHANATGSKITDRSLHYWTRTEVPDEYDAIYKQSTRMKLREVLQNSSNKGVSDFDAASLIYMVVRNQIKFCNDKWYILQKGRWVEDDNRSALNNTIANPVHDFFSECLDSLNSQIRRIDAEQAPDGRRSMHDLAKRALAFKDRLRNTLSMNSIVNALRSSYSMEDQKSMKFDAKKHLLGCANGVLDFKLKCFRPLESEDMITKNTGIHYHPLHHPDETPEWAARRTELETILRKIYPLDELYEDMMEYCATILTGVSGPKNQKFVVFHGKGANGKTFMLNLLRTMLGDDYARPVSMTQIISSNNNPSGHNDELAQCNNVRLVYFEESKKKQIIQDDMVKRMTGGGRGSVRRIYGSTENMSYDFACALFTNYMFDLTNLQDEGIWRRIIQFPHLARFLEAKDLHLARLYDFPEEADVTLNDPDRLVGFAEMFLSMLTERAFVNDGLVTFGKLVQETCDSYKKSQNILAHFFGDKVIKSANPASRIPKNVLIAQFREWARSENIPVHKMPDRDEVIEYMKDKFGPLVKNKVWMGVELVHDDDEDDEDMENVGAPVGGGTAATSEKRTLMQQYIDAEKKRRRELAAESGTDLLGRLCAGGAASSTLPVRDTECVDNSSQSGHSDREDDDDDDSVDSEEDVRNRHAHRANPPGCSSSSSKKASKRGRQIPPVPEGTAAAKKRRV